MEIKPWENHSFPSHRPALTLCRPRRRVTNLRRGSSWHHSNAARGWRTLAGRLCQCLPAAVNLFVCGAGSGSQHPSLGQGVTRPRGCVGGVGGGGGICWGPSSCLVPHRVEQPLAEPAMPRLICVDMGPLKICLFRVRRRNSHRSGLSVCSPSPSCLLFFQESVPILLPSPQRGAAWLGGGVQPPPGAGAARAPAGVSGG